MFIVTEYAALSVYDGNERLRAIGMLEAGQSLVEEPGFKNVKNKHLGMPPF